MPRTQPNTKKTTGSQTFGSDLTVNPQHKNQIEKYFNNPALTDLGAIRYRTT